MRTRLWVVFPVVFAFFAGTLLTAQVAGEPQVALKNWPTPLYFQPTPAEAEAARLSAGKETDSRQAQGPPNSLVFVGMTPCRVVDTRVGQPFTGAFGPPSLSGGATRSFPLQSSPTCSIPAVAQAYSMNVTVVPPGPVGFITVFPTGQPLPLAATVNAQQGYIVGNAAIVPAGTGGAIDVFASSSTDIVIDINGYFAAQNGITLAQGTQAAPAMSFAGDAGTGIFSSGAGTLNIATAGANRLTVDGSGNLSASGNLAVSGTGVSSFGGKVGIGMTSPSAMLTVNSNIAGLGPAAPGILIGNPTGTTAIWQGKDSANFLELAWLDPNFGRLSTGGGQPLALQDLGGNVGVGTTSPRDKLEVAGELRVSACVKNAAGTQIAGACPSDLRLKTNIQPFDPILTRLVNLQPVHFDWRAREYPEYHFGTLRSYGLIAQDVERDFPELVSADQRGFKSVNYSELPLLLLQGIRDLNTESLTVHQQLKLQEDRNRQQAERIQSLESRLAVLEALLPK
jgi:hypothetical protein